MTLLIFFSLTLTVIFTSILLNRLVRCSILVALTTFSAILLAATILSNTTLIIAAVILGIIAFLAAFLDCVFMNCKIFDNNKCLTCNNPFEDNSVITTNDTLTIINSNGEVVGRINNNNSCGCCNRSSR